MRKRVISAPGDLIEVTVECTVGEVRRVLARLSIRQGEASLYRVLPGFMHVIGGHDLLWGHPERNIPIPGTFYTFDEASEAAVAWATAFNEIAP